MGILLCNWHLKLGALALATVLYTGLVFSGSFTVETEAGVLVEGLNQPDGTVLLGAFLGTVDVRYRASPEAVGAIDPSSFAASVDLSAYDFALTSVSVEPAAVTIQGIPDVLEGVNEIPTEAISIAGASAEQEISASLVVPEGARLLGNADATVTVTVTIVPSLASRTFVVGVACVGAGENACLPSVTSASVTLSGPAAALGALTAAQVTPFLDVT